MKTRIHHNTRRGFTLVELLTVIAIIGILAAILIPAIGGVTERARRAAAGELGRQIGLAYQTYTSTGGRARRIEPGTNIQRGQANDAKSFAAVLALKGDLNTAEVWYITEDTNVVTSNIPQAVVDPSKDTPTINLTADAGPISWGVIINVPSTAPISTTPIIFTRGIGKTESKWEPTSPWLGKGGHIVYLDAHQGWYDSLDPNEGGTALQEMRTGQEANSIGGVFKDINVKIEQDMP